MVLSIVTTLYRSAEYIEDFYRRIRVEAQKITTDYEIIFVNDGSPDDSLERSVNLYEKDAKVKVIDLSRNFGHHKAIMTGLAHANGDYIFLIDSDLEEEPELLGEFWQELHNDPRIDMVYGIQAKRKGGWFERWSGNLFYNTMNLLSNVELPRNFLTVRLMTSRYVNSLTRFGEREMTLINIIAMNGYRQKAIVVKKHSHSPTTYSLMQKLSIVFNVTTSSSAKPLYMIFYSGMIITLLSALYIFVLIFNKLVSNVAFHGWTSLMVSVWFLGGMIIMFLGIIGIYISKIFVETKQRPYTIIRNLYEQKKEQ
ncbi:MAG: glycosyltransferase family 2 protein [Campylobacterota bacterium]